jgi:outer membrane protein assembly factor BamB
LKKTVSGIMLTILLASMLTLTFSIQPVEKGGINNMADGSVDFGGESGGFEAQSGSVDWWPMFHHDLNHSGYTTSKAPGRNQTLWSYTTANPFGFGIKSSPAVAGGIVYVGSSDYSVYALNASTGTVIWSYGTGNPIEGSAAVADGRVYIGSGAKVRALNASTGGLIWSYTALSGIKSSPAVADGIVYIGSETYNVYALNASTGAFIWSYATGGNVRSSPAVAGGIVYVGSTDCSVYALNGSNGALIWSYGTGGLVESSPAVANGIIYVGSNNLKVWALNASTGAFIWSYTVASYGTRSSPAVADGIVYIGSYLNVYALNASTGARIWSYATGQWVDSSPAVADGKVYVGSWDSRVYCLNASTGARIWSYATGGGVESSPAVADGKVYVGSRDSKVYAFGSHDVAIMNVTTSTPEIYTGQMLNINVVAKNEGTFNETFNVRAYYDSTLIGTQTVTDLPQDVEMTLIFSWNTTDVACGYYTISANASVVFGETDTADNTRIDGTVKIVSPVRIAEVIPCNQTGYPKNTFHQGAMAFFKVIINSTALIPQNTLITINLYDNSSITIGVASFQGPILPGISTIIFGLPITTTATIGTATIYANCYTDWPSQGGFPHCPEMSATLEITGL